MTETEFRWLFVGIVALFWLVPAIPYILLPIFEWLRDRCDR